MTRILILPALLAITLSLLSGCVTPIHKSFTELKIGDDKAAVVELLGNPRHTLRRDGKDFWIYRYFRDDVEYKRSLGFEEGRLTSLSPEERINDPREALIEQQLEEMSAPAAPPAK